MRGHRVLVVTAGLSAVLGAGGLTAPYAMGAGAVPGIPGAVRAAGSWGKAIPVPGLAALGPNGYVLSVSCPSAGNCAAVGNYRVHGRSQGFVASERHGRWGKAIKAPKVGALYSGRNASVQSVSCGSAGNCVAGGSYRDRRGHGEGFLVVERNGRWHRATAVPGLGPLNKGSAGVSSVSCTSAKGCLVGGNFTDKSGKDQAFVVVERQGHWGKPVVVRGLTDTLYMSCSSAGNCGASDGSSVADEKKGVWGKAIAVPGLAALDKGGEGAEINSLSCGAAGSCAVVGDYANKFSNSEGWVAVEKNGVWGKAIVPPGLAALNGSSGGGNAETDAVSCASAGNCAAVGLYGDPYSTGFVAVEKNGVWAKVTDVGVNDGRINGADSVSCGSPGNCAAGGFDSDDTGGINHAWVSTERNGSWDGGTGVPGLGALNKGGYADVGTVSCPPAGGCVAGGYYTAGNGRSNGFVVSQSR